MNDECHDMAFESEERPRERLLRRGSASLSDAELVAVLLRTGVRGSSAVSVAQELLRDVGGLRALTVTAAAGLRRAGVGDAKVASLLAAAEIGRRLARTDLPSRRPLREPEAVARYLALAYQRAGQEVMGALYLDTRHRLVDEAEIFRGTLTRACVEPRQVLKRGIESNAAHFVLFHTHPSGDPAPSAEDLSFTRRMAEAGDLLGIGMLDHLILGGPRSWLSLREYGAW